MFTSHNIIVNRYSYMFLALFFLPFLSACGNDSISVTNEETLPIYAAKGRLIDNFGRGVGGVEISYSASGSVFTDDMGNWLITDLSGQDTIVPKSVEYTFSPLSLEVESFVEDVLFVSNRVPSETEVQILNWFDNQQLSNGLLESVENGNVVSLYDNALAAMVYMLIDDFAKAEKIFDFFADRINTEFTNSVGGFSQLRNRNGIPNGHRWMGDNAWLLIALNNYKMRTGKTKYDNLTFELSEWLISLQDEDGGLFAGYDANNSLLSFKVTEGNIDAFNAIDGYTVLHGQILAFLEHDRWDSAEKSLVAWPENPTYLYALDLHPWGYAMFNNYPAATLTSAQRFVTTQTATSGTQISGYCFDEDKDTIWLEGTGQMALAFGIAGMQSEKQLYLNEMEQILIQSTNYNDAVGFPYVSNPGSVFGSDRLWIGADTKIAISGGAWYLFAKYNFNPFAVGRDKDIPEADMFWLN